MDFFEEVDLFLKTELPFNVFYFTLQEFLLQWVKWHVQSDDGLSNQIFKYYDLKFFKAERKDSPKAGC